MEKLKEEMIHSLSKFKEQKEKLRQRSKDRLLSQSSLSNLSNSIYSYGKPESNAFESQILQNSSQFKRSVLEFSDKVEDLIQKERKNINSTAKKSQTKDKKSNLSSEKTKKVKNAANRKTREDKENKVQATKQ